MKIKLGIQMVYFRRQLIFFVAIILISFTCIFNKTNKKIKIDKNTELVFNVKYPFFLWVKNGDTVCLPNYFLYKDSFMLQALHVLESNSTNGKEDTSYYRLVHYRFEDLRNKVAYFYTDFTPEAKLRGKLATNVNLDSLTLVHKGYYLQGMLDEKFEENLTIEPVTDTMFNNTRYQRFNTSNTTYKGIKYYRRYWAIKNDTLLPFSFLPKLSTKTGLAYINSEIASSDSYNEFGGMIGIWLDRREFTIKEKIVFDAWRKNCEKYKERKMGVKKNSDAWIF